MVVHVKGVIVRFARGFTIVELVVVVAVLALLLAILMPTMHAAREMTRITVCQAYQRQFVVANEVYAAEFRGFFVPIHAYSDGTPLWYSNKTYMDLAGTWPDFPRLLPGLSCPSAPTSPPPKRKGWHHGIYANIYGWNHTTVKGKGPDAIQLSRVPRPGRTVQFIDGTDWHITETYADYTTAWDVYGEDRLWSVAYRHHNNEGCVITHFDGHSAYYTKAQTYSPDVNERKILWNVY
ncbi:MAG: prepilin-type N-terminal cleavage/methylation domain-containing protein [Phycisphaera sp.]|nr:prepilin-type N-terminal cleavage/methylation domain-containing protein [Phycisphaera sp.]